MPVFRPAPPAKVVVGTGQDGCRSSTAQALYKYILETASEALTAMLLT